MNSVLPIFLLGGLVLMSFWLVFATPAGSRYAVPHGFRWILFAALCIVSLVFAFAVANTWQP